VEDLENSEVSFNGAEREFATEVFTEGFGGDADNAGDFILRDAAAGEKTGEFAVVLSGAEGGAAGAVSRDLAQDCRCVERAVQRVAELLFRVAARSCTVCVMEFKLHRWRNPFRGQDTRGVGEVNEAVVCKLLIRNGRYIFSFVIVKRAAERWPRARIREADFLAIATRL
jgi:hypothetical protein